MNYFRPAQNRGHANFGWLDSRHSFSFGNYYDPNHMGFSVLRVINDDSVKPGAGFDTHGHRDMEIITYVIEGAIEHRDSTGNSQLLSAGEVQRMSAGSGIFHSEFNASTTEPLRFLQIWIQPAAFGIQPGYQQARIDQCGPMTPLVTPGGAEDSLRMHQDASLYRLCLRPGESHTLHTGNRLGYLHVISGSSDNGKDMLNAGDGLGLYQQQQLSVTATDEGMEALWFDLPIADDM